MPGILVPVQSRRTREGREVPSILFLGMTAVILGASGAREGITPRLTFMYGRSGFTA